MIFFPVESSDSSSDEEEETEEKFQKEALEAHNDYRVQHGVSKLKLDAKVSPRIILNDFKGFHKTFTSLRFSLNA